MLVSYFFLFLEVGNEKLEVRDYKEMSKYSFLIILFRFPPIFEI